MLCRYFGKANAIDSWQHRGNNCAWTIYYVANVWYSPGIRQTQ